MTFVLYEVSFRSNDVSLEKFLLLSKSTSFSLDNRQFLKTQIKGYWKNISVLVRISAIQKTIKWSIKNKSYFTILQLNIVLIIFKLDFLNRKTWQWTSCAKLYSGSMYDFPSSFLLKALLHSIESIMSCSYHRNPKASFCIILITFAYYFGEKLYTI